MRTYKATMYFQVRINCCTPGCACTGLWAYLKVHSLVNGDVVVGLGPRRVEKPEDFLLNLDSPKSHASGSSTGAYIKKTLIERSVIVVRKPVGSHTACLEAVSSYSKTTKRLKDPLRLTEWPCGHVWPYSRLKTYVALAEYIAFDILQCKFLKLFDAANVSLRPDLGPTEDLYPLSLLRIATTGQNIYGSYGYIPLDIDHRSTLLLFRKLRVAYQALSKKPETSAEWDSLVCAASGLANPDAARKTYQFWAQKDSSKPRAAMIHIERRDMIYDSVPQWLRDYQDRWKDVY